MSMAVGTVLCVAESLLSTLQSSELKETPPTFGGQSQKLENLQRTIMRIIGVLRVAEAAQKKKELSGRAQDWIQDIKDALFEADDLVDEVLTLPKQNQLPPSLLGRMSNLLLSPSKTRTSRAVKVVKKKLDAHVANSSVFGFDSPSSSVFVHRTDRREPTWKRSGPGTTSSHMNEVVGIIGREGDVESIVRTLLASNNTNANYQRDVSLWPSALSIVGQGGVGKTALAQLVFNHPGIKDAFPLRVWTCVSWANQINRLIVTDIFDKIDGDHEDLDEGSPLEQLHNHLEGKRYLLVLDNLCTENPNHWFELVNSLPGGATGSCILVTTSSQETAAITGNLFHELSCLSELHSWLLFHKTTFSRAESNPPAAEFLMIRNKILKGCSGVPLAIRVVGSFIYSQYTSKGLSVPKIGWPSVGNNDDIMPMLKLSFHHLEAPLKSCILYCVLFPKNHVIEKEMLMRLWIAQDYVVPLWDGQSLEDAAQEYFTIFLHRCFLQDVAKDAFGEIISCQLQGLLHDLASHIARREMCLIDDQTHHAIKHSRHLSLKGTADIRQVIRSTGIRSLLRVDGWHKDIRREQFELKALIKNCRCLRTLDLSKLGIETLPNSIGELLHLRYLNLSQNSALKVLPKGITILFNLQTLILRKCHGLTKLPEDLCELTNLRVLDIEGCTSLTCMPCGLAKLTRLHMLTEFVLSETSLNLDQGFDLLEDLKALQNLRGHLAIRIQSHENAAYAKKIARRKGAYLSNKAFLSQIQFSFIGEEVDGRGGHEELMGVLQPHANIKGLNLRGYDSAGMPGWITLLPNLVTLCLENCRKLQCLPYLGNLIHLKVFRLVNLLNLAYIFEYNAASASGDKPAIFPSLEQFHLINLPKLKRWFRSRVGLGIEDTNMLVSTDSKLHLQTLIHQKLESLIIKRCPNLEFVSPGTRVEELSVSGAGTSSTKDSIGPATDKTHDSKAIEGHKMDSSFLDPSLSLEVRSPQKTALPPAMVDDDGIVYTPPLSVDLQSPQSASPFDDKVANEALLYCSLFPPEYEFEKITLLQLWLADGIFDEEPMEEIAGIFFENLLAQGYFEVSRIIFLTSEPMYIFKGDNDLVLKGSHVLRMEDTFNSNDLSSELSHMSVSCRSLNDSSDLYQFERFKQLRTLMFLQGHLSNLKQVPRDFFLSLKLLRTLDLSHTCLEELPSSIGNMKCLRYLDLTKTPIKYLPEALDCLENLQTLKLRGCSNLSSLPKGMRKLEKLRHLDFDVLRQLRSMPEGMGALTNIRTLPAFIVGAEEGCSLRQLKNMNNLSGSFCLSGLQNVLMAFQAIGAYLHLKSQLRKLELRWSDSKDKHVTDYHKVFSSLQPHADLEELRISCYGGLKLPSWICDQAFHKLFCITLYKCENCLMLPSFGKLPALKSINIVGFNKLKVIDHEFYGGSVTREYIAFPELTSLTIQDMPSLEEWRDTENPYFSQLSSFTVKQCPKLSSLCTLSSSLHTLKYLEITQCGKLASCFDEERPPPLETIIIEECPLFNERISNDDQDWFKLLPQKSDVWIDHQKILGPNSSEEEEEEDESEEEEKEEEESSD